MGGDGMPGPGDLGRRIAARRQQIGWSRAELASRAGLSLPYLTYLETHPSIVTMATLIELAEALETTAYALLGAGSNGRGTAAAGPVPTGRWMADVRTGRPGERPGPVLG